MNSIHQKLLFKMIITIFSSSQSLTLRWKFSEFSKFWSNKVYDILSYCFIVYLVLMFYLSIFHLFLLLNFLQKNKLNHSLNIKITKSSTNKAKIIWYKLIFLLTSSLFFKPYNKKIIIKDRDQKENNLFYETNTLI